MKDDKKTSSSSKQSTSAPDLQASGSLQRTSSLHESRAAIDKVIGSAHKIIRIFDRDLSDPGYSEPERIKLLESFILASRRNHVQIVLHNTHNLDRDCARLMALFRHHANAFAIHRTLNAATHAMDALVIADEHSFWHRPHQDQPQVSFVIGNGVGTTPLLHRFNEIWESSELAVAANVLGL